MIDEYERLPEQVESWPTANYHEQELIDYQGNPLIEALPPILSQEGAYDKLCFYPPYLEGERQLAPELRFNALYRLQQFFQPVTQHLDLERRFSRLIRTGYLSRNPFDPSQVQLLTGEAVPGIRRTASSFTLMGVSGIGKTTAIERILSLYPQCILHPHPLSRIQIVWLKINCPHDGSLKSLCMDFFLKIDDLIGTNYYQKFGNKRNSISSMVTQMGRIARLHCIGALIIDEIQHLLTAKEKGSEQMMNFFVTLINEVGIPVMLIGTMRARTVLQQDFRQARRGSGQGDMVWEQMKPEDDWSMLIEEMWRYQWTQNKVPLTEEIRKVLYEESQGIVDIAVKLYSLAQSRAIETERETITSALIRQVAKEDLRLVQPMLQALKSGSLSEIEKYEDIMPMDLASYLQHRQSKIDLRATIQKKKERQAEARQKYDVTIIEKAIQALIALDIEPKLAEKVVVNIMKQDGKKTKVEVVTEALEYIKEYKQKKSESKQSRQNNVQNKLTQIIEKGKKQQYSAYDSLLDAGYIKQPLTELVL
ncbi:ATP-binding protein [Aneurinibacillus migulanus]|uniref:AAA domain-containing protein n=1 Tax=Aneurinibacillus migulanus TaxID=47500 RepID=A0A0M0GMF7_ANEMI|nr:ATP-binding protein [Aneurinibacillus migulanus]KON90943.1 Tn7 transposition protein C [Aneurinibacillus migulanus]MED0893030.1 ATP-binding protein [Aneurinibacillus migulanus]MED1618485.1 ATP-binding protein [Aneurinibacillus migulanus]SDK46749.1 AAA domain-containing protein [Aneurinibacillus migulanus]GED17239.1 hypothetical protein AMI01nite_52300 [Aneurinibacillus migulanus]